MPGHTATHLGVTGVAKPALPSRAEHGRAMANPAVPSRPCQNPPHQDTPDPAKTRPTSSAKPSPVAVRSTGRPGQTKRRLDTPHQGRPRRPGSAIPRLATPGPTTTGHACHAIPRLNHAPPATPCGAPTCPGPPNPAIHNATRRPSLTMPCLNQTRDAGHAEPLPDRTRLESPGPACQASPRRTSRALPWRPRTAGP
jgi:hypothetical protein